jgi:hypothetical protein
MKDTSAKAELYTPRGFCGMLQKSRTNMTLQFLPLISLGHGTNVIKIKFLSLLLQDCDTNPWGGGHPSVVKVSTSQNTGKKVTKLNHHHPLPLPRHEEQFQYTGIL